MNGKRSSKANLDNWSITIEEIQDKIVAKAEKESNMGWLRGGNNVSIAFEIETPVNTELNARTSGVRSLLKTYLETSMLIHQAVAWKPTIFKEILKCELLAGQ